MEQKDWFEEWFDSPFYHLLYDKRNDEEACRFINKLITVLDPPKNARIWDNPCGNGRHARHLATLGFQVTGTDLSPSNIAHALENAGPQEEYYVHDMRNLFRTSYYDHVLNIFTSIGYFEREEDNIRTFRAIASSLKPKGVFTVDFFNAHKVSRDLQSNAVEKRKDIDFHISRKIEGKKIIKTINFEFEGVKRTYMEKVSLFEKNDLEGFAKKAGLHCISSYGDYSLQAFDPDHSDRLILLFQRTA